MLSSSLSSVVLLLAVAFICGAGYAGKWLGLAKASSLDVPQLLVPTVSVTHRAVTIEGVATADGRLNITLQGPRWAHLTRASRLITGKTRIVEIVPDRPTSITLVPTSHTGTSRDPLRFACRQNAVSCAKLKPSTVRIEIRPQLP